LLILTRKVNERITIGDQVEIVVLKASKDKVKLGINAPDSVVIQRNELLASVTEENMRAATGALDRLERLLPALRHQLGPATA
jgi:carbon storage regulator